MNSGAKILIIEDEPRMRKNMATVLKMEGFEVVTAEHGAAGVEAAHVIVDLIEDTAREPQHLVLPVELIVRGSTRSPARDGSPRKPATQGRNA